MEIADNLDADYVVLHTGSSGQENENDARKRTINALNTLSDMNPGKAKILLENTAGRRGDVSSRLQDLAEILYEHKGGIIGGVCIDTCHAYAAGYDLNNNDGLSEFVNEIDKYLGRNNVKLIHLNDSKKVCNSKVDRHEHIGKGNIGKEALKNFVIHPAFDSIPIILETPKKTDSDDPKNLKVVRRFFKG